MAGATLAVMGKLVICVLLSAVALAACGDPDPAGDPDAGPGPDGTVAVDGTVGSDGDGGGGAVLTESFGIDGADWPAGWRELGGVASATVAGGRGRLVPTVTGYTLGRMGHVLPAGTVDVDVTFTLSMAEPGRQGVGFYVRQNGGHLMTTNPPGTGYAVFVEAFRGPQIGVWREIGGNEQAIRMVGVPAIAADTPYAVRFRCAQAGGETTLEAKLWPAGDAEPAAWNISTTDASASLQGLPGDVAIDAWNTANPGDATPGPIFVDDIVVSTL
jgi:hypothetical protein